MRTSVLLPHADLACVARIVDFLLDLPGHSHRSDLYSIFARMSPVLSRPTEPPNVAHTLNTYGLPALRAGGFLLDDRGFPRNLCS